MWTVRKKLPCFKKNKPTRVNLGLGTELEMATVSPGDP